MTQPELLSPPTDKELMLAAVGLDVYFTLDDIREDASREYQRLMQDNHEPHSRQRMVNLAVEEALAKRAAASSSTSTPGNAQSAPSLVDKGQ